MLRPWRLNDLFCVFFSTSGTKITHSFEGFFFIFSDRLTEGGEIPCHQKNFFHCSKLRPRYCIILLTMKWQLFDCLFSSPCFHIFPRSWKCRWWWKIFSCIAQNPRTFINGSSERKKCVQGVGKSNSTSFHPYCACWIRVKKRTTKTNLFRERYENEVRKNFLMSDLVWSEMPRNIWKMFFSEFFFEKRIGEFEEITHAFKDWRNEKMYSVSISVRWNKKILCKAWFDVKLFRTVFISFRIKCYGREAYKFRFIL